MPETLGFDIFATDRASSQITKVGKSAEQAANDIAAANIKVEKSARALAAAEARHGKTSLEARDAAVRLQKAQLQLNGAMGASASSTEKAGRGMDRFRTVAGLAGAAVGASILGIGKQSVAMASDVGEATSKVQVVFGKSAGVVTNFAETTSRSMGISKRSALEAAGTFGNLFVSLKLPQGEAAKMSTRMVQLAGDMASFNNATPEEALEALRSGLVGETEPLRRFGVNIQDATLRQEAMKLGLISTTKDALSPAVKAQASYSLILAQTKTAQGDFARTSEGLANTQRTVSARWEDAQAMLGERLLPVVLETARGFLDLADYVERNADVIRPVATGFALLAGSVLAVNAASKAFAATSGAWSRVTDAVNQLGDAGSNTRTRLGSVAGFLGGPYGIALTAATIGVGMWAKSQADAKQRVDELTDAVKADSGALGDNTRAKIANRLESEGLLRDAQRLGISLRDVTDAALGEAGARGRVNAVLDAYSNATKRALIAGSGGRISLNENEEAADRLGAALTDTNSDLAEARGAYQRQAAAAGTSAAATGKVTLSTKDAAAAMKDERTAAERLRESLDRLSGKTIAADEAAISYKGSVASLSASFKENGRTVNINTEAGRRNRQAVIDAAKSSESYRVALRDRGVSEAGVTRAAQQHRTELVRVAEKAGMTRTAARRLIDTYLKTPKTIDTRARLDKGKAERDLAALQRRISTMQGKTLTVRMLSDGTLAKTLSSIPLSQLKGRASGGILPGAPSDRDNMLIKAASGEFVVNARATSKHRPLLEAVNRSGLPGYATGGLVDIRADSSRMRQFNFAGDFDRKTSGYLNAAFSALKRGFENMGGMGAAGGGGMGYQRQMAVLRGAFPGLQLISGFRPGAITATGNRSYHSMGRAVDIPPSMEVFNWIRQRYGGSSRELIFSPAGGRQVHNGRPHVYTGVTKAMHYDHVHWAMDRGGLARGAGYMAKAIIRPERVLDGRQTRAFERWMDRGAGNGGGVQIIIQAPNYVGDKRDLIRALDDLRRERRLPGYP